MILPGGLKIYEIEGSYEEGILTLNNPKEEEAKPKDIKVEVKRALADKK